MKPELLSPDAQAGTTLVCFALKEEVAPFRKLAAGRRDVVVLITGMGAQNSEHAVRDFLMQNSPQRIFTCGFAGGLDPQRKIGDVVFATEDHELSAALERSGAVRVRLACVPRIAVTVAEKARLRETTQADAVEMESEIIQTICREREIPCATIRVISDTAQEDLPLDFHQLCDPDQSLNFRKLAVALAKSPGKIPALLQLQRNTALAAERLTEVLAQAMAQG